MYLHHETDVISIARSMTSSGIPYINAHSAAFEVWLLPGSSLRYQLWKDAAERLFGSLVLIRQALPVRLQDGAHVAVDDRVHDLRDDVLSKELAAIVSSCHCHLHKAKKPVAH